MLRQGLLFIIGLISGIQVCLGSDSLSRKLNAPAVKTLGLAEREKLLTEALSVVDQYMSVDQYDSSQIWLNKIADLYDHLAPSRLNYYFTSRHAEIYYYNRLFQLGLKEAASGMHIAAILHDSILLADAYNLGGLLYLNLDSLKQAKQYFHQGLSYARNPPYPAAYVPVSNPHHLYSNLAECCERLGQWDSAHNYNLLSLQNATAIDAKRGMAVANYNLGNLFLRNRKTDSAEARFSISLDISRESKDVDVELVNYLGLAECAIQRNDHRTGREYLEKGFMMLETRPEINALFSRDFLRGAMKIFRANGDQSGLLRAYTNLAILDSTREHQNTGQVQHILQSNISNENRLLKMQITESNQKQEIANSRLYIALALILLLTIGLLGYRYYFTQKIRLATLRNNISRDLHDDVGASLSSIHIYGSIAEQTMEKDPDKAKTVLRHITENAKQLVENLGDIVWAINSDHQAGRSFGYRIKNFGYELLNSASINCNYDIEESIDSRLTNPQTRKNLLLIVKEAINNIVKYSGATSVSISLRQEGQEIILKVQDNGRGFEEGSVKNGHGLNNIRSRARQLNGSCEVKTSGQGTLILCRFPLTIIRDKL